MSDRRVLYRAYQPILRDQHSCLGVHLIAQYGRSHAIHSTKTRKSLVRHQNLTAQSHQRDPEILDHAQDIPPIKGILGLYHRTYERSKRQKANKARFAKMPEWRHAARSPKETTPYDGIPCGVCSDWLHIGKASSDLLQQLAELVSMLCAGSWRLSCHVWGTSH